MIDYGSFELLLQHPVCRDSVLVHYVVTASTNRTSSFRVCAFFVGLSFFFFFLRIFRPSHLIIFIYIYAIQHNGLLDSLFRFIYLLYLFIKDSIDLFLERGEGREKERERNINVWLPLNIPPTGDLARNPGMCPDWEMSW